MMVDILHRRVLGAVRFLNDVDRLPIPGPLRVTAVSPTALPLGTPTLPPVEIFRNRLGWYVVQAAPGLGNYIAQFDPPPTEPAELAAENRVPGAPTLRSDYQGRFHSDLFEDLGVFGRGSFGEVSGDDRLRVERLLVGVPHNDRERAEVAMFTVQQQLNERGALVVNAGSPEERALLDARDRLRSGAGAPVTLDEFGRPSIAKTPPDQGAFDEEGNYQGPDRDSFGRDLNFAQSSTDAYVARTDRIASYVSIAIAVVGAVVGAVLTVVTAGAAGPLVVAALATGLASMAASAAVRGGRYGWEDAAVDLGMTAVQAVTAGVGAQLGAASKAAVESAKAAGASAAQLARMGIVNAARIGAIGGVGGAALNERTWQNCVGSGLGLLALGGVKGAQVTKALAPLQGADT